MSPEEVAQRHGPAAVRQAARHALWRAADPRYMLHTGQLDAVSAIASAPARRFVLCTGRRWGKSRCMVWLACVLIALRIMHRAGVSRWPAWLEGTRLLEVATRTTAPARVVYAAPTAGMVAEFVEPHLRLMAEHAPPELRPTPHAGSWRWPDGSRLVVSGCEDRRKADRLRGPEADMGIIDEGGFIPILDYVVRSVVGPQLWETRGQLLLPSTPPESSDHEFVGLLAEAEMLGASYRARTADAPHITPAMLEEAIADAGGADSLDWLREGEAMIVRDPRQAMFPEWPETRPGEPHPFVAEHYRPEHYRPVVVGDHGYVDLCVILFGYYDVSDDLDVIEDELVMSHATSVAIDAAVRRKEAELWPDREPVLRAVDATPQVRADMSNARYQSTRPSGEVLTPWDVIEGADAPTEPEVLYWQPVRKDDLHAAVNAARLRIARRRIVVHPRCVTVRSHVEYARWNAQRTALARPDTADHHYDGAAALVYFVRSLDRSTNPVPAVSRRPATVAPEDWYEAPRREHRAFEPRRRRR